MRSGRVLAVAAAVAVLAVPLVPAPAVAATAAAATLVVAPEDGGVVGDDRPMDVQVLVTNTGTAALPAGRLSLSLGNVPVASSTALLAGLRTLPGQPQGYRLTRTSARTPALAVGAAATIDVRIPAADLTETLTSADGSRLLDVQLQAGDQVALGRSALTRMADDAPRVGFGTVVPITIPAGTTGIVDAAQQAELTADGGAWSAALAAARAMPAATVALDPAVLASVRLAGDAAPETATAFLDDLAALPNEVVRLPYADGDVTLQRAAGATTVPVPPGSFAAAATTAQSTASTAPTPAATPSSSADPDEDDLLDWAWSDTDVTWPVPGTTTSADLAAAPSGGVVLIDSGDVQDSPARIAAGPLATASGRRLLVADTALGSLLSGAAADGVQGASAAAALVAALATDAAGRTTTAVLAVAARGTDPAGLGRVLGLLDRQAWVRGEAVGTLAEQSRATALDLRGGLGQAPERIAAARALIGDEHTVQQVAKAAADPAALAGPYRLALLGVLSAGWRADERSWGTAVSTTEAVLTGVPAQVTIEDSGSSTQIGTDGRLVVRVQNRLPQPVTVVVSASVDTSRLRFSSPGTVTIAPNATAPTRLSFRSISNGTAVVTLTLATEDGARFGTSRMQQVTVRAGFDTIVAVILLAALGLLLALGVYRNVVRRRRPRVAR